jgi:hypothetical protein
MGTLRRLADESFVEIINLIYCHVMSSDDLLGYLP